MGALWRHGPEGSTDTLTGRVVTGPIGGESKQRHSAPFLETAEGPVQVFVLGDNPFEAASLAARVGETVELSGTWRGLVLRVAPQDITALPSPGGEE